MTVLKRLFLILMSTVWVPFALANQARSKSEILKNMVWACEKNSTLSQEAAEVKRICECIAKNHGEHWKEKDLLTLESRYLKRLKPSEPIDDMLSIMLQFDAEVADACILDTNYRTPREPTPEKKPKKASPKK